MTRLVLRVNAVAALALGVVLLLATWDRLYGALDLPDPGAAIYAQAGGAFAVAFGYLLWIAPRDRTLTRVVSAGSALANLLVVLVGVAWIVEMGSEATGHHTLLAAVTLPTMAALGLAEAAIASRKVAILLPSD